MPIWYLIRTGKKFSKKKQEQPVQLKKLKDLQAYMISTEWKPLIYPI